MSPDRFAVLEAKLGPRGAFARKDPALLAVARELLAELGALQAVALEVVDAYASHGAGNRGQVGPLDAPLSRLGDVLYGEEP